MDVNLFLYTRYACLDSKDLFFIKCLYIVFFFLTEFNMAVFNHGLYLFSCNFIIFNFRGTAALLEPGFVMQP